MDVIDAVKSVLPYVFVLILGIIGSIIGSYLKPHIDTFFEKRREKRLKKDKKANKAFEEEVNYYLRRPDGRIEAVLYIILLKQSNTKNLIAASVFLINTGIVILLEQNEIALLFMLITGFFLSRFISLSRKMSHQGQVYREIDKRLLEKESQKPPKSSQ